jgi:predicted ArsR family transcriptional regulator
MKLFDHLNICILNYFEEPHTVLQCSDDLKVPRVTARRRIGKLVSEHLLSIMGKDKGTGPDSLVYLSNTESICIKLDQNRYFVRVKFKDGTIREEGYSA